MAARSRIDYSLSADAAKHILNELVRPDCLHTSSESSNSPGKKRRLSDDYKFSTPPNTRTGQSLALLDMFDDDHHVMDPSTQFPLSLEFQSLHDATSHADRLIELNILDDDLDEVQANACHHVLELVQAFFAPPIAKPPTQTFDARAQTIWDRFQAVHVEKVAAQLRAREKHTRHALEIGAWRLYGQVVAAHRHGVRRFDHFAEDRTLRCSARLDAIVAAIADYGIVRYDVVRGVKCEELVASPAGFVSRKVTNWKNNHNKIRRDEDNAAAASAMGVQYTKVLGGDKEQRGATTTPRSNKKSPRRPARAGRQTPQKIKKEESSFDSDGGSPVAPCEYRISFEPV